MQPQKPVVLLAGGSRENSHRPKGNSLNRPGLNSWVNSGCYEENDYCIPPQYDVVVKRGNKDL